MSCCDVLEAHARADTHFQKKQKRRKYQSVDHFMKDIDTMFNNAKIYNEDESQVYKDAVQLQVRFSNLVRLDISDGVLSITD